MSVSKSTIWKNHNLNSTFANKKYILKSAKKQYWFNITPSKFEQNWSGILKSSINYNRSKRKDYRFVFSVKKQNKEINLQRFYAMCIQFQKSNFKNHAGLFAIHQKNTDCHVHFLLNPIDISNPNRKFHKISPENFQIIKENWEHYLKIFNIDDGHSYSKLKQRSWGKYFFDRKNKKKNSINNFRYNLSMRDNFINKFFNPSLSFLNRNANTNLNYLKLKKYKKNQKYSYFNTTDLLKKIQEIKRKWNEIKLQLSMKKVYSNTIDSFFNLLFSIEKNGKFQKSFAEIYSLFSANTNFDNLFSEVKILTNEFFKIQNYIELENELENDYIIGR